MTARKKKNILIVPAGTQTATEIYNSLSFRGDYEFFGLDTDKNHSNSHIIQQTRVTGALGSEEFEQDLKQYISEWKIDFIFLTHDEFLLRFPDDPDIIQNAKVIISGPNSITVTSEKRLTYQTFPEFSPYIHPKTKEYPMFIKPNRGRGSRNCFLVDTSKERKCIVEYMNLKGIRPIVCEYLPGHEYTVDCINDQKGNLLSHCIRKRLVIKNGITHVGKVIEDKEISHMAQVISEKLEDIRGPWFFQVKRDIKGIAKLLEINLRIGGCSMLSRAAGLYQAQMTIDSFEYKIVNVEEITYNVMAFRNLESTTIALPRNIKHIISDWDDTIAVEHNGNGFVRRGYCLENIENTRIPYHIVSANNNVCRGLISRSDVQVYENVENKPKKIGEIVGNEAFLFVDDSFHQRRLVKGAFPNCITMDPSTLNQQNTIIIGENNE